MQDIKIKSAVFPSMWMNIQQELFIVIKGMLFTIFEYFLL